MPDSEGNEYACLMADLPEPLAERIRAFASSIPDSGIYDEEGFGREDIPHITVKYGFYTDNPSDVEKVLRHEGPVRATLKGMSAFNADDYEVLKIDVESDDLHRLHSELTEALKCKEDFPEYKPHTTIAYLVKDDNNPEWYEKLYSRVFDGEEVVFDKLRFSTSDDKEYGIELDGGLIARVAEKFMEV